MCHDLIVQEGGQLPSVQTRSQQNIFECNARIETKFRPRVDSYERCFVAQMGKVFGQVPPSVVEIGLQKSWKAANETRTTLLSSEYPDFKAQGR